MRNLTNPKVIALKGLLFLLLALLSAGVLFSDRPTVKNGLLLILVAWSSARFYYFTFYVMEHYVDSEFRFSGLISLARYLISKKKRPI
jgi:hypothetical protein